jgi:methylmalonyl-CoA/ethylmalonyl-CoA epimerase
MNISHIEHIGIAVKSLEEAIPFYEDILGLKCYKVEEVKDQKVKTAFFKAGETKIELLESMTPDSPVGKFIAKKGQGVHHIAFAVDDADESLKELENKGITLIDKHSRKGAEGLDIAFLHPRSSLGVLIEICSKKRER